MNKLTSFLWAVAALPLLYSCGHKPNSSSILQGVRSNENILLIVNSFTEDDGIPGIGSKDVYIALMTDSRHPETTLGYAIDCTGSDSKQVYSAFGITDGTTAEKTELTYEDLVRDFKIDEQPHLKCSSVVNPQPESQQVKAIFRVIQDGAERKPYADYFVKFAGFENELYSIGCKDFFDTFGFKNKDLNQLATPVLASTLADIFPKVSSYKEISCVSAAAALPPVAPLETKVSKALTSSSTKIYSVIDGSKKFLLVSNGLSYSIQCPSVPESDFIKAFRFPSNYSIPSLSSSDPLYINAKQQPPLRCKNPLVQKPFDNIYLTVNETPKVMYLRAGINDNTLLRFGCDEAKNLFPGQALLSDPSKFTAVTRESIAFLTRDASSPSVTTRVLDIPCNGTDITPEPNGFTPGEVISLRMDANPSSPLWFRGQTDSGSVNLSGVDHMGLYWFVEATGESGSFYLQSLDKAFNSRYLACPLQGNQPVLTNAKSLTGYDMRWFLYRSDKASSIRLACRAQNGDLRWLNGATSNPVLSGSESAADAGTSWGVYHHTFTEDSNLLAAGSLLSFQSLLAPQSKRWLSAYPAGKFEVGLEDSMNSASTYFQSEARGDGRGVSLKSLSLEQGDHYLDCMSQADKRWFELAPQSTGIYIGTGYKAFRLSNTTLPIFKLACFDNSNSPFWMGMTGNNPWLTTESDIRISNPYTILSVERREKAPGPPGAAPKMERIPEIEFIVKNTCGSGINLSILSYGPNNQWTTKTQNLAPNATMTVKVVNQYTYWYGDYNVSVNYSDVQLLYNGTWRKTVEFNHRYTQTSGGSTWYNQLMLCQ